MQLELRFAEIPVVETQVWNQLDDEQRAVVIETLARVIAQVAVTVNEEEEHPDD